MENIILHMEDNAICTDIASISADGRKLITERLHGGPTKTRVVFRNHDTGEILGEYHNKVVITGSQLNACAMFGLEPTIDFPTYNSEMGLDNSADPEQEPKNHPIVCLFCVGDTGCGTLPKDVFVSKYTDRIKPGPADPTSAEDFDTSMIMPFRYVDAGADLSDDLRKYYFGRKTFDRLGKIGYYFKSFDTEPQLHLRYADGTQITKDLYNIESNQEAECYVEMRLRITRLDFRDYFENILGWDKARISSLSLCTAWYDDSIDGYRYYQDIMPYTILFFSYQWLVDDTISVDIEYQIYY